MSGFGLLLRQMTPEPHSAGRGRALARRRLRRAPGGGEERLEATFDKRPTSAAFHPRQRFASRNSRMCRIQASDFRICHVQDAACGGRRSNNHRRS